MKENGIFHVASGADIVAGRTTDVYFERTLKILRARGVDPLVTMEVAARELPLGRRWALFAGLEEALRMLGRLNAPLEVRCIEEGTVFGPGDAILSITGRYTAICLHETPLLGLICQASGIATAAARCRKAAGDRTLLSFGARRAHPCIAPMIDRSAWIGGADGVSAVCSAAALGIEPAGTMPHALVLCLVLCLYRILRGPTVPDRAVAIDIMGIVVVGFCAVLCVPTGQEWYIDIGIAWALQSFIATLALAKYLEGKPLDE